ncbi:MAG: hypothetical protein OHK0045_09780 [Raineya sp.]
MLAKIRLCFLFLLVAIGVLAQKPAKSSKELSKNFIKVLQTKNVQMLQDLAAPPAMYKLFAPHLKQMSEAEIADILKNDKNSLENKLTNVLNSIKQFGIVEQNIEWKGVKEKPLNAVAADYFLLPIAISYQKTEDTIWIEAFKNKNKWYLTDIASVQNEKPLSKIIFKHAKYSSQQYYDTAVNLIKEKKFDEALKNLESAAFLSPENPDIYFQKANIYKEQKDLSNALKMYRLTYAKDPEYAPAYFEMATLALDNPDIYYEAIYGFEFCLEKEYQVGIAAKQLLEIYQKQIKELEENQYSDETYLKDYYEKIIRVASKLLEKEEELSQEDRTKAYMLRATKYLELERYDEARSDFEKVLREESKNRQALYELAWIENETKNYTKALDYAKKAYELDKNNGEALAELAFAKMQTQDFKGAINDYTLLFTMDEKFRTAKKYQNRGDCYKSLKNNKMACADYKKAIALGAAENAMQEWIKKNCK